MIALVVGLVVEIAWCSSPTTPWTILVSMIRVGCKHYTHAKVHARGATLDTTAASVINLVLRGLDAGWYQVKKAKGRPRKAAQVEAAAAPPEESALGRCVESAIASTSADD